MYAIVRAGGRQEKVAVGDVLQIDKVDGEPGSSITLPALLVVDGETVTSDPKALAGVTVTAEVVGATKGPEDHDHEVQEQDRLPQAAGPPAEVHRGQGHRHRSGEVSTSHGTQEGRVIHA